MKKRTSKLLSLNKKSVSNLNEILVTGGAAASSNSNARTNCMSCTRSCRPDCLSTFEPACEADA